MRDRRLVRGLGLLDHVAAVVRQADHELRLDEIAVLARDRLRTCPPTPRHADSFQRALVVLREVRRPRPRSPSSRRPRLRPSRLRACRARRRRCCSTDRRRRRRLAAADRGRLRCTATRREPRASEDKHDDVTHVSFIAGPRSVELRRAGSTAMTGATRSGRRGARTPSGSLPA